MLAPPAGNTDHHCQGTAGHPTATRRTLGSSNSAGPRRLPDPCWIRTTSTRPTPTTQLDRRPSRHPTAATHDGPPLAPRAACGSPTAISDEPPQRQMCRTSHRHAPKLPRSLHYRATQPRRRPGHARRHHSAPRQRCVLAETCGVHGGGLDRTRLIPCGENI